MKETHKKMITIVLVVLLMGGVFPSFISAQNLTTHTVKYGDTLWKIAVRYQIGITEIIEANPQIKNPDLIYPNQKINIPVIDRIKSIEHKVIQLCNQERANNGLGLLRPDWQISRVARHKSQDMRDRRYFSHTSPTYGSPLIGHKCLPEDKSCRIITTGFGYVINKLDF